MIHTLLIIPALFLMQRTCARSVMFSSDRIWFIVLSGYYDEEDIICIYIAMQCVLLHIRQTSRSNIHTAEFGVSSLS